MRFATSIFIYWYLYGTVRYITVRYCMVTVTTLLCQYFVQMWKLSYYRVLSGFCQGFIVRVYVGYARLCRGRRGGWDAAVGGDTAVGGGIGRHANSDVTRIWTSREFGRHGPAGETPRSVGGHRGNIAYPPRPTRSNSWNSFQFLFPVWNVSSHRLPTRTPLDHIGMFQGSKIFPKKLLYNFSTS